MKAPLSWLREYVSHRRDGRGDRATADDLVARGRPARRRRRGRRGRQPRALRRRKGDLRRSAPERRSAPALPGRRRQPRPAADRLRRVELRRRRDGRRRAPRRAPARLPRPARGAAAPRRGVPRDDPRGGRDRARRRPRRDHAAPRRAGARDPAAGRPAARRPRARRDADDEPARPALAGGHRARDRGALRRRASPARAGRSADPSRTSRSTSGRGLRGLSAVHRPSVSQRPGRASPQWLRAGSISRGCAPSRTSST